MMLSAVCAALFPGGTLYIAQQCTGSPHVLGNDPDMPHTVGPARKVGVAVKAAGRMRVSVERTVECTACIYVHPRTTPTSLCVLAFG